MPNSRISSCHFQIGRQSAASIQDFFSKGLEMKQLDNKIAERLCFQYEVEGKDMALDFKVHKRKCEIEHLL